MLFCPNCGAQVDRKFCGTCGRSVEGAAPPPTPSGQPAAAGLEDNVAGALCYILGLITGVLFLVLEPYSRNRAIRFHAFQSIFLNLALIAVYIALSIVGTAMGAVFQVFSLLLIPVWVLVWLGSIVLWIMLLVKTFNGTKMVLPVIGPLAEKQAG